jgi:formylmethanofuran dehydrogenase subunit A
MSRLKIAGGHVVDPANRVDGVGDVWIEGGKVVDPPSDPSIRADRTIDARGYVVMPAGVDVHCHIAGPKVNTSRMLRPEEARRGSFPKSAAPGARSGTLGSVPSSFSTGARYAGLGYATAIDAAIAPLGARATHHEFRDTPIIDKAFLVLMGNNHYVMDRIKLGERERLKQFVAWLLGATRGFGVKVVNPGGVETWKQGGGNVARLDDIVPHFEVTPRQILIEVARAVDELGLPHPMHFHGLNLGLPGNSAITLETMQALDGHRAHFAHIQFHSYGGEPGNLGKFDSQVGPLADYLNAHPNLTVDVGQVMFGETTSMTADGPVGQYLHKVLGRKWVSHDLELETGCGIVPITYDDKNAVHALQWAIGLEWYLRVDNPWQVAMSTDHPNGGSFLAYPQIIALLMDRGHRLDTLKRLPEKVRTRCGLADLTREYTLSEIAVITRAGPARMLGLRNKGHLGVGADGDVTIYAPDDDKEKMFSLPRYLIKNGEVVLDDGELRLWLDGSTLHVSPPSDPEFDPAISEWFEASSSISFENYPVMDEEVANPRAVETLVEESPL